MSETSAETKADARERSWRTLLQGVAIDVGIALVLLFYTATETIMWTKTYWIVLGFALAKTAIQTGAASLMRHLIPPRQNQ